MKNKTNNELPEAGNQKELERHIKEMLGPPPQEATEADIEVSRQEEAAGVPEVVAGATEPEKTDEPTETEEPVAIEEVPEIPESGEQIDEDVTEDETTAEAVDDISHEESDELLAAEDAELEKAFTEEKPSFKTKLKAFFSAWWQNKIARWATIIGLLAIIVGLAATPYTRYFILNTAGVRSSASLVVVDDSTQQPLKNVQVQLGGQTTKSGEDGNVKLTHVKLGKTNLVIKKSAFAVTNQQITVGLGSNPLGTYGLKAVGNQYSFIVTDFLSGKPIEKAEATSGEASALSDKDGKILLTIDTTKEGDLPVTIAAKTYRDQQMTLAQETKDAQQVSMVPARKEVFVSKRSGKYDVYKTDVDGKNEELVLKGTGNEQDTMALIPHPTAESVAYVSTRDNVHNKDGFLLSTLLLINLEDNTTINLAQSEKIQVMGWIGDNLIFVKIAAGASAANPKRQRLISYNYKTADQNEIASSNYFNDVTIAGDSIYYATSGNSGNLTKSNADGVVKQTVMNQEVWNIYRTAYDTLNLAVNQDWYEYKLGNPKTTKLSAAPANLKNRVYNNSPDAAHSLWVDERDGKGVLLAYDINAKTDKILHTQSGLNSPVRWISNNTVIYRIHTDQETADYVINIDGGDAKKIKDVTNTTGIDQWYYY